MKIIQVSFSGSLGGMERYMVNLSVKLLERGEDVTAVCRRDTRLEEALRSEGVPYFSFDPVDYIDLRFIRRLRRLFRELEADIVHSHTSRDLALLLPASGRKRTSRPRCVFTMHMDTHHRKKDPYHRFMFANLDRVFAITDRVRKQVIEAWPVPEERVVTVYNGIDFDRFQVSEALGKSFREENDIPLSVPLIGITGRLEHPKGQDTFVEAAALVLRRVPDAFFVVVGGDDRPGRPFLKKLEWRVEELRISDRVRFTGWVDSVAAAVSAFDLFVMLSHCEAFGLVILEAHALKKPVIATRTGGVPEIIVDGETGVLVPPMDPYYTAVKIRELLKDREERDRLASGGYHRARSLFSMDEKVDAILNHYREVINQC